MSLLSYFKVNKPVTTLPKWRAWAAKLLRRRNHLIDLNICAYDKTHLITKVQAFGGGSVFWSSACDGCQLGSLIIKLYKANKNLPQHPHCALLQSGLLTQDQVKTGQIYHLPARQLEV